MFKKILIFVLTLNAPYILSSHSSSCSGQNLALSCIVLASGVISTWIAYKGFKQGLQSLKEVNRQLKILKEMGVKVSKVSKGEFGYNSYKIKEHYAMKMPSSFSQQQVAKAKEHWGLFLSYNKKMVNNITALAALGSLILIPTGISGIIGCIKSFQ